MSLVNLRNIQGARVLAAALQAPELQEAPKLQEAESLSCARACSGAQEEGSPRTASVPTRLGDRQHLQRCFLLTFTLADVY